MSYGRATPFAALGLLAAAFVLSACGGSNPPSNPASAHVESAFKFSKCMRENGVKDFPDPKVTAGGGTELSFKGEGVDPRTMGAAQKACRHFQEEGEEASEPSPQEQVEREEEVQKFAKCMREHGIEVQASASHGGVQVGIHAGPGAKGPNPNSPVSQAGFDGDLEARIPPGRREPIRPWQEAGNTQKSCWSAAPGWSSTPADLSPT